MHTYLILIGKTKTGYSAHCPDVLGCAATGKTVEQTVSNMKGALVMHVEGMAEDGEAIPQPGGAELYREILNERDAEDYLIAHVSIDISRLPKTVDA